LSKDKHGLAAELLLEFLQQTLLLDELLVESELWVWDEDDDGGLAVSRAHLLKGCSRECEKGLRHSQRIVCGGWFNKSQGQIISRAYWHSNGQYIQIYLTVMIVGMTLEQSIHRQLDSELDWTHVHVGDLELGQTSLELVRVDLEFIEGLIKMKSGRMVEY
jgi:hypothetical protein